MGNRHGGEKAKEEKKQKKKKKEKKVKPRGKRKQANSDVDLDMESSHVSRADSESMVFHSAENLSPYLDASTRSQEGVASAGFYDNDSVVSSSDFHDGFSIEACLPADLVMASRKAGEMSGGGAAAARQMMADDVASIASGGYSTPLVSSPQIRRGPPRSPLAQRPKDSFYEPVPPIPSDLSSNTTCSSIYQDDLSTSGERSSSRTSSSTIDTNAASCIERLEELERTLERTIIEKFSDLDNTRHESAFTSDCSPLAIRRLGRGENEPIREGSLTPRGVDAVGGASQSVENSPSVPRHRPFLREGSNTPKGTYFGLPSRSIESSPVLVKKIQLKPLNVAKPTKISEVFNSLSPTKAGPGSPGPSRAGPSSPGPSRAGLGSPGSTREAPCSPGSTRGGPGYQHGSGAAVKPGVVPMGSPVVCRKFPVVSEESRQKSTTLGSPLTSSRRLQRQEDTKTIPDDHDEIRPRHLALAQDELMNVGVHSRSPEARRRPGVHTPSSSPSPKSLGRKVITVQGKLDPEAPGSPRTIRMFEASKGTPVKHCSVASQPSTAVVIPPPTLAATDAAAKAPEGGSPVTAAAAATNRSTADDSCMPPVERDGGGVAPVSEEVIIQGSESAVFGSVSPKLKRQRNVSSSSQSHSRMCSFEEKKTEGAGTRTRSPPTSPRSAHVQLPGPPPSEVISKHNINVIQYKGVDASRICISTLKHPSTCKAQIIPGERPRQEPEKPTSCDVTTKITYRSELSVPGISKREAGSRTGSESPMSSPTFHDALETFDERAALAGPIHSRIQLLQDHDQGERARFEGSTVSGTVEGAQLLGRQFSLQAASASSDFHARRDRFERGAFSSDSTVEDNAREEAWNAKEVDSEGRAREREGRSPSTPAHAKFVQSPPPPRLESGSDTAAGKAIGKNLGERIREVIKECTTFREVFTAELSPSSSVDKDAGSSTDESFSPPGTGPRDKRPYFHRHPPPPPDRENFGGSSTSKSQHRTDRKWSPSDGDSFADEFPPFPVTVVATQAMAAEATKLSCQFQPAQSQLSSEQIGSPSELSHGNDPSSSLDDDPTTVSHNRNPPMSHVIVQKVGSVPTTINICRLETGASVALPKQQDSCQHPRPQQQGPDTDRNVSSHVQRADSSSVGSSQTDVKNSPVGLSPEPMKKAMHPVNPALHASQQAKPQAPGRTVEDSSQAERPPLEVTEFEDGRRQEPRLPALGMTAEEKLTSGGKGANQSAADVFNSVSGVSASVASGPPSRQGAGALVLSSSEGMSEAHENKGSSDRGTTANISQTPKLPVRGAEVQTCSQPKDDIADRTKHAVNMATAATTQSACLATNATQVSTVATDIASTAHFSTLPAECANTKQGTSVAARAGFAANGEGVADVEKTKDSQRSDNMSREQRSEGRPKQGIVAADEDRRDKCTGGVNVERDSVPLAKEQVQLSADQLPAEYAPPPVDQTPPPTNCAPPPVVDSPPPTEIVPPPTPSPMDMLAEEDEEEVDKQEDGACWDTKQSHTIPKDVQLFGEIVVRRLSSLLECRAADNKNELDEEEHSVDTHVTSASRLHVSEQFHHQESNRREQLEFVNSRGERCADDTDHSRSIGSGIASTENQSLDQHDTNLPEMLSDFRDSSQLPLSHIESSSSRPLSLDTLDTLSTDQDTSSSSKRTSTASTATDETLTSFKTRSTTDSAEFEESSFILLESLVFVRSVDEDEGVRPTAQEDLDNSESAWESQGEKPRQKRRRQVGNSLEVPSVRVDAVEPEPKRGSQRIRDVIDAYHEENSDDSYISSCSECASHRDVSQEVDLVSPGDEPLRSSPKEYVQRTTHTHRTTKHFQGDRRSASSDSENGEEASGGQRGSSNVDSSLRIPEIEDTFGELMSVKTFLEDLQDRTPTAESQPVFLNPADVRTKDFWSARRRSKTSPARTDRTESDLDTSEQRDDASTDSMYADDEDDGAEVVFQRSYSEEHGGEVLLSCTIYNSSHDNDADSDDFWAESSAAEESYKQLETSADAAGSAFQNARLQMHDIHQHLQDLRRQMELLQEDITSTSLTLTPEYSFESCEQRPVTE